MRLILWRFARGELIGLGMKWASKSQGHPTSTHMNRWILRNSIFVKTPRVHVETGRTTVDFEQLVFVCWDSGWSKKSKWVYSAKSPEGKGFSSVSPIKMCCFQDGLLLGTPFWNILNTYIVLYKSLTMDPSDASKYLEVETSWPIYGQLGTPQIADDTFRWSKACSGQTPKTFIEISDDFRISNLGTYHLSMILLGHHTCPTNEIAFFIYLPHLPFGNYRVLVFQPL